MKKISLWMSLVAVATALMLVGCASGSSKVTARDPNAVYQLVILHTNDHHGVILPSADKPGKGGLAERASYVKQVRGENKNVLLLDAGDINTGTAISNMFKAEPDVKAYNMIGYDAVAFGNHEFDSTLAVLEKQMKMATFPFISANVMKSKTAYLGKPYIIKDFNGFRVGIFGLTTARAPLTSSPDKSLQFNNEIDTAKAMVKQLREGEKCDIVIALGHLGNVQEAPDQITSIKVAENVSGIDMFIDGHSHTYMEKPLVVNGTPIVSANDWGKYVGNAVLNIKDGKIIDFSWKAVPITTEAFKADAEITAMLAPYIEAAKKDLDTVVAKSTQKFEFGNRLSRYREIALGDMVGEASTWYLRNKLNQSVDFAFTNGGNIRAELPEGNITKGNIATVLPFDNWIYVLTMKGSDVVELFNFIGSIPQGSGGFPQMSKEVRYTLTYDEKGQNGKISGITINGAAIDPNKTYKIVANDFLANGGDGYAVLKKASESYNTSVTLRDVVVEYMQQLPQPIDPTKIPDGRIKLVGGITNP